MKRYRAFFQQKKKKKEVYQSFFKLLPHNRCSGLIPSIQRTVSRLWSKLTRKANRHGGLRSARSVSAGDGPRPEDHPDRGGGLRSAPAQSRGRVPAGRPSGPRSVCRADHSTGGPDAAQKWHSPGLFISLHSSISNFLVPSESRTLQNMDYPWRERNANKWLSLRAQQHDWRLFLP